MQNHPLVAEKTPFYFAMPIVLTPGQTYYLVPSEVTGDDVWSVAVTDNTYANGQLYGGGAGGAYPFTPAVDLWFREGVVATPEPSDLALLASSGLLLAGILGTMRTTQ